MNLNTGKMNPVLLALAALWATSAAADVTRDQEFSYQLNKDGRISVDNVNGNIDVTGGSGDEVKIVAHIKADDQKYLDEIKIKVDATDDQVRIETHLPESHGFGWLNFGRHSNGSVNYEITVPASANLDTIESVNGAIDIRGVSGNVRAETVNGHIEARDLAADVKLETVNGTIDATLSKLSGNQKVHGETVNGRLTMQFPGNADATVTAETVNGGIDGDDFGLKADKGFIGRDLKGTLGEGTARVSLSTVNGSVRIRKN